jgi:glutathione S-transferase
MANPTLIIGNRNYSSWSLRAWLALVATGQDFDEVVVQLGRPETEADILRWSPNGRVPAFRNGINAHRPGWQSSHNTVAA